MNPFIFTKSLLEARVGLDDDSNREYVLDDEGNLAEEGSYADTDDEEFQGLRPVDPDEPEDTEEEDASAAGSRRAKGDSGDASTGTGANREKSFARAVENDARILCNRLVSKLRPIYERYRVDVLPEVETSLDEMFESVRPTPEFAQQLIHSMEELGIAMREHGIPVSVEGNERPITPDDLTSLYMLTLPARTLRDQYTGRTAQEIRLPDESEFRRKASRASDNILGHGIKDTPAVPHTGDMPFYKSVMAARKTKDKGTEQVNFSTSTRSAEVTYDGPSMPGTSVMTYVIPERVFRSVCENIKKNAPLMAIINAESASAQQADVAINNMAAEWMFLGGKHFKGKYGVPLKSPGRGMRGPMFASWDGNTLTTCSSFIEGLFASVIIPAMPNGVTEPEEIYRPDGTRLSEEEVKAFADAFSGGKMKNTMITIPMDRVRKYIAGNYSIGYNREPVFSFFHTGGIELRTDARGQGEDDDNKGFGMDERVAEGYASAESDTTSANAGIVAADARIAERVDTILAMHRKMFGSNLSRNQDEEGMRTICADVLEGISDAMQDIGSRSYVERNGDSVSIHIDPAEAVDDDEDIGSVWRRVYLKYKAEHGDPTANSPAGYRMLGKLLKGGIFEPVKAMVQWIGSFDKRGTADINRYVTRIMYAGPDEVRALTPSVRMDVLMHEHILKNEGDILDAGVPDILIGGKPVTGQDVVRCVYTYLGQICRACGYGLATPKSFEDAMVYMTRRYANDIDEMVTAAVSTTDDFTSLDADFANEYEQAFLQFIVSRIPDIDRPELIPPQPLGEGESVDDYEEPLVIDLDPKVVSNWLARVYNIRENRLNTLRICYSLAMVLANMCSRGKNKLSNRNDTLNNRELDNIDAAVHMNVPLNQLHARSYTSLMAVIAHYSGDDGAAMQTLLKFISQPPDTELDEAEATEIVDAAKRLGELDFMSFPVFEKKDFGQRGVDETQVILDEIASGKKSSLYSSRVNYGE